MGDQVAAPGPTTTIDPRVEARLTSIGRVIRWLATIYAFLGLIGVIVPGLGWFPPGPPLIRDLTTGSAIALAVMTLGALLAGDVTHSTRSTIAFRRSGIVLAVAASIFGLFIMVIFFANRTDIWGDVAETPAFSVGVILLVLGISVALSVSRRDSMVIIGQVGALLVFSITAVIFLGYMYGDPSVGRLFLRPEISFQAALTSVLAAVGVLLMRPAAGLLSVASSPGAGGRLLRRMGPVVLFTPAVLLYVAENVPRTERVDVLAFLSVGLGLFLLILLTVFVRALDATAIEAATSAAQAERARIGLQQEAPVVTRISELLHIVEIEGVDGWEVATRYRPGRGSVAGDASSVRRLPDGSIGVVLVDLTGHGALPAVWAIRVRDLLLHSLISGSSPAEAMRMVDWSAPGDSLASAVVATVHPETGEARLCSAGHPPVAIVRTQEVDLKLPTGPLLYLTPEPVYEEERFELSGGDTMVAFSDGIADVQVIRNGQTEPEMLGDMLLAEGGNAARTADLVLGFADAEPNDDQTVVVIRRSG
ncbi:MAG TPA: PP2C family protein-serine/threonine phosphatase [Acidimicrobiia bacterium]|nr:PP2C family protein-serine/threonine phosphatase [Acidimicrobiia bacterium]